MFCTSEYQKNYAEITFLQKDIIFLKIGYPNNTLLFELNVPHSNCHNSLGKSAIEIWGFSRKVLYTFSKGHISSSNKNI